MISAREAPASRAFDTLEARAARLAASHAEERLRAGRADPVRWRLPRLLWPLMTGDD
jgi:hypothetical protein